MKHLAIAGIALLLSALSLEGQERPGARDVAQPDTLAPDSLSVPRIMLRGDLLSRLPLDAAARLLEFFPGFMRATSGGLLYRADGASFDSYVDGVPVRSLIGDSRGLIPSINALELASLTTGGVPATRRSAAVVDYETRAGGRTWSGDARVLTDGPSPGSWDQHLTRVDLGASGPIPGVSGLHFSIAGHLLGQKHTQLPGTAPGTVYLASGVDTTIALAGTFGPVDVVVPEYVPWSYDELPLGNSDRSDITAALTYGRGGAEYGVRFYRTGSQGLSHALDQLYNQDAWRGTEDAAQMVSLSARSVPLPLGLTGDVVLSHQQYDATSGMVDPLWANTNAHPSFGINIGGLGFLANRDDYRVTDPFLIALRSGVLPASELTFTTMDSNLLPLRQGVPGVAAPLRLNPYGMPFGFATSGVGDANEPAISWATERRWYGRAALSREFGAHSLSIGGEVDRTAVESLTLRLADESPVAFREKPSLSAAFVQGTASLHGIRVEAGVRAERHSSDAALPRTPGFVINVPDSLRGDAYTLRPGTEPWQERLERVVDCGVATPVCTNNFVPVASHTAVSPRLSVSYEGAGRFSARASYGSYVQPRRLMGATATDLSSTSTSAVFPRETDPVRENVAEVGARLRTADASWIDLQLFRVDVTNPVVNQRIEYIHPFSGAPLFLISTINGDSRVTTGIELSAHQQIGTWTGILGNFVFSRTDVGGAEDSRSDPMRAAGIVWFDVGEISAPASVAGVLDDLTLHLMAAWAQGGRYTRMENLGAGYLTGRINTGFGMPAEEFDASRLPSRTELDVRVAKGFRIGSATARLVADLRNPLGIENVHTVFAETGTTENARYDDLHIAQTLLNYTGTGSVNDIVVDDFPGNDVNRHMMRRAEQRFGNGDGIYTTAEMRAAVGSYLDLTSGRQWLVDSERELRLGIEVSF